MASKFLRVTMPDNTRWDVPLELIAQSYVDHYPAIPLDHALNAESELMDHAENNMNWVDVKDRARIVDSHSYSIDYQDGWCNGEKEVVER